MQKLKKGRRFSKKAYTDKQSSFISTPEYVAKHIANTILNFGNFKSAVELCSCVGSMCIQMAKRIDKVIGVDIDENRIKMARKNAKLYGVSDKVLFIKGNVLDIKLLKTIKVDIALLDPGWSARAMDRTSHAHDIDSTQPSLRKMFNLTNKYITSNIVARVPATFTCDTLKELGQCKLENIIINDEIVFKVAYFIGDIKKCYQEDIVFE